MAAVMNLFWLVAVSALLLINNAHAQYKVQSLPYGQQVIKATNTHPFINTLLSTYSTNMPIVEKLNTIATVIQKCRQNAQKCQLKQST
ncbi:hypothetical protein HF086_014167 [Spodoptera exigua]|uniref:Uncharacterized protein n=1 Tax=Spodoptera exigua TaxID=7107 RepID=A0A922SPG1_SPOEX|nr:hypothetical protein HF086_014167 [Spodoptera exigua]